MCWCPEDTRSAWRGSASGFCVKSCLLLRYDSQKYLFQREFLSLGEALKSTRIAVDYGFTWLIKDSLKHAFGGLVIFFFFTTCIGDQLSQITNGVVLRLVAKPLALFLNKIRAHGQLLPSLPSDSPLQSCRMSTCYVPALYSQVFPKCPDFQAPQSTAQAQTTAHGPNFYHLRAQREAAPGPGPRCSADIPYGLDCAVLC